MPAHHAKTRPSVVANARHSPGYGCALRLDRSPRTRSKYSQPLSPARRVSVPTKLKCVARPGPEPPPVHSPRCPFHCQIAAASARRRGRPSIARRSSRRRFRSGSSAHGLGHESIDPEDQRKACYGHSANRGKRCRQHDETTARDSCGTLRECRPPRALPVWDPARPSQSAPTVSFPLRPEKSIRSRRVNGRVALGIGPGIGAEVDMDTLRRACDTSAERR